MSLLTTPSLGRRRFLAGSLGLATSPFLPAAGLAQGARIATPAQTAGPFYPQSFPADIDGDLVRLRGSEAKAEGTVAHVGGQVLGLDGKPLPDAVVEIWQCDARGRYLHPRDRGGPRDGAFQGYGRVRTGADGAYRFRTIRPVAYPGRTPHIHFAVAAPGRKALVTQMYVAGEPLNARDGLYASLREAGQRAVTVRLSPANGIDDGALAGTFDIVLG
jgi:protocatechuate 3,4-dioxygenase beta subunit